MSTAKQWWGIGEVERAALRACYTYLPDLYTTDARFTGASVKPPFPAEPTTFAASPFDWVPLDGRYFIRSTETDYYGIPGPFVAIQAGEPAPVEQYEGMVETVDVPITAFYRYPADHDEAQAASTIMRHHAEAAAMAMQYVLERYIPTVARDGDATSAYGITHVIAEGSPIVGEMTEGVGDIDGAAGMLFVDAACTVLVRQIRAHAFVTS